MIKGSIDKFRFELPESYEELTLGQLEKLSGVDNPLEQFSILSGIDMEVILKTKHGEVEFIIGQLESFFADDSKLNEIEGVVESVTLRGVELFMDKELVSIPSGQWFDMKKYESDLKDKPFEFLKRILSILMRPEGEDYDHEKCASRLEWFNDIDVVTAFKVRGFFLLNLNKYLTDTIHSSPRTTRLEKLGQGIRNFLISSVVYLRFTIWQRIRRLFQLCLAKKKK